MDPPYPDPDLDLDVDAEGELDQLSSPATAIPTSAPLAATSGVAKRYRPAQAKTFQCRGYGECRMVFSRSEHLARHIRKHTGERPFNCHCGKQFSRLDNLRQHAQTVHADKPAENETMMRQLSSLHATITGQVPSPLLPTPAAPAKPAKSNGVAKATKGSATTRRPSTRRLKAVKVEEENITISQRPGTSTGYEGAAAYADMDVEPKQEQQPSPPLAARGSFRDEQQPQQQQQLPDGGQSFRDHRDTDQSFRVDNSQSFRAQQPYRQQRPSPTPSPPAYPVVDTNISNGISSVRVSPGNAANSGSFPFTNRLSSGRNGPASAGSRPGTGGGAPLPSLASLIPASSLTFRRTSAGTAGNTDGIRGPATNSILLPNSLTLRHPSTGDFGWDGFGSRPGTAPGKLATAFAFGAVGGGAANAGSIDDPSPFSFHPPDQSTTANGLGQSYINPRKRALSSAHGPYGAHPDDDGAEYGSQSRPASRRLSVMELINDDHAVQPSSVSAAIPVHREREWERERPITTNGLVSRASALVLDDEHAGEWEREREPRQRFAFEFGAGGQSLAASGEFDYEFAAGGTRSRPGSVRGRVEKAAGGANEGGVAIGASGSGGGVSSATTASTTFLSNAATRTGGAGATISSLSFPAGATTRPVSRGSASPSASPSPTTSPATAATAAAFSAPAVPLSASARARDAARADGACDGYGDTASARVSVPSRATDADGYRGGGGGSDGRLSSSTTRGLGVADRDAGIRAISGLGGSVFAPSATASSKFAFVSPPAPASTSAGSSASSSATTTPTPAFLAPQSLFARGLPGISSFGSVGVGVGLRDDLPRGLAGGGLRRVRYGGGGEYGGHGHDAYEYEYAEHAGPPCRQSGGMTAA